MKFVFNLLLAFVLSVGSAVGMSVDALCICPVNPSSVGLQASEVLQAGNSIAKDFAEICADCGHSISCCKSHKSTPLQSDYGFVSEHIDHDFPRITDLISGCFAVSSHELSISGTNKAPPKFLKPTLFSLNQQLLI